MRFFCLRSHMDAQGEAIFVCMDRRNLGLGCKRDEISRYRPTLLTPDGFKHSKNKQNKLFEFATYILPTINNTLQKY